MSRPNGLSSFTTSSIRYYKSIVKHENHFIIYQHIKDWFQQRQHKHKFIFDICISKIDYYCTHSNEFKNYIEIHGQIFDENVNDNDVFEELYLLFEYLFINLKLKTISFSINDQIHKIKHKITHKI
jgi:hypothetical protein